MLTDDQAERVRAAQLKTLPKRASIWRTPAAASGSTTTGAPQQVASDVACNVWPAAQAGKAATVLPDLGDVRYAVIGFFLDSADVRTGDELRIAGKKYKVAGVGTWATQKVAALSEMRG